MPVKSAMLPVPSPHLREEDFHVLPHIAFLFRAAVRQQEGGVIGDEDGGVAVAVEAAAEFADGFGRLQEGLGGDGADADDVFGAENLELPLEEGAAVFGFVGERVAIVGGTALEDVHDIDVGALPAAGFDDLREQLPGPAYERLALPVFIRAGGLAEERDARPRAADAEHRLLATAGQLAAELAPTDFGIQAIEQLLSLAGCDG
jgi:hypothetical protein